MLGRNKNKKTKKYVTFIRLKGGEATGFLLNIMLCSEHKTASTIW